MLQPFKRIKPSHVVVTMVNGDVFDVIVNIGYEARVSDYIMTEHPFIVVFDIGEEKKVMILNKFQILSVEPKEEASRFVERRRKPRLEDQSGPDDPASG